jgi:chaperone required for assembly of F1-ATPase
MTGWASKRFWKLAEVAQTDDGFTVRLDGRPIRTPGKLPLVVPTRALADLIAAEWNAQDGLNRPETMPATRAANSAIEKVRTQRPEVAAMIAAWGETDLLCYRAEQPAELVARQAAAWDPLLDWAARRYGVEWTVVQGVMPRPQPPETVARLAAQVAALDPFRLTAFHDLVALPGSLVIGLAVTQGQGSPDSLWAASRIDEDWQAEHWGSDPQAAAAAETRKAGFLQALRFYRACD